MKLIGMREFVLENIENNTGKMKIGGAAKSLHQINEYAHFLSQPLTLGMFVPCDLDGNVLEEPKCMYIYNTQRFECSSEEMYQCRKYNEAKERVLFEGFEYDPVSSMELFMTEKLINEHIIDLMFRIINERTIEGAIKYDLTLTQQAIKQITP